MANTCAITYTCGCTFAHNTAGGKSQDNFEFKMCQPHAYGTSKAARDAVRDAGTNVVAQLNHFLVVSGNKS